MELSFETRDLRRTCESEVKANQRYGDEVAGALRRRLADLRAAATVHDLVAGVSDAVTDEPGIRFVELGSGYRMIVAANHPKNPETSTGEVDWERVRRVKIIEIEQLS